MQAESRYREYAAGRLGHALVCTWAQEVGPGTGLYPQRVLPDGCLDIICKGDARPLVVGPFTRPFVEPIAPGTTFVAVRFRPGRGTPWLGPPASALRDREVALAELWGRAAAERLFDAVAKAGTVAGKLAALEAALGARRPTAPDALVEAAVDRLARQPALRVDRLAPELGVSARQLQRRFHAAVGYGPKAFQRVARFQRLLALAHGRWQALGTLALAAGYADQAHMTREVSALAGVTPTALLGHAPSTLAL